MPPESGTLGENSYHIPLIYGDGYIVVRYRGIGRGGNNYAYPLEGEWNLGAVGTVSSTVNYIQVTAHESNGINYGAGMSFIENGVKSVGVTYMDGVLKPRQSQAKLNSQDKIIAGSNLIRLLWSSRHWGNERTGLTKAPWLIFLI